jgi:plastocyanin
VLGHPVSRHAGEGARLLGLVLLLAGCAIGAGKAASGTVDVTVRTALGQELGFAPAELTVPAGVRVRVIFTNVSSVAHNLVFTSGIEASTRTIVEPGASDQLAFTPAGPGAYPFVCTIHDGMRGTLSVQDESASR